MPVHPNSQDKIPAPGCCPPCPHRWAGRRGFADDGHGLASRRCLFQLGHVGDVPHGIALEAADVQRIIHHAPAATDLAEVLADVGAGSKEVGILADEPHGVGAMSLYPGRYSYWKVTGPRGPMAIHRPMSRYSHFTTTWPGVLASNLLISAIPLSSARL